MGSILLERHDQLDLALYRRIAFDREPVSVAPALLEHVERRRAALMAHLEAGASAYGVNTGLGYLADRPIPVGSVDQASFQRAILAGRAAGTGRPLPEPVVRGAMLLRLTGFLSGYAGVSAELCRFMLDRLNDGWYPVVPGGVSGAAGEIVPLAHLFSTFVGDAFVHADRQVSAHGDGDSDGHLDRPASADVGGRPDGDSGGHLDRQGSGHVGGRPDGDSGGDLDRQVSGQVIPAADALAARGVAPFELGAKEGIALINGAPLAPALAIPLLLRADALLEHATLCAALAISVTGASVRPYDPRIGELKGDPGQLAVHGRLWSLLDPSPDRLHVTRQAPVSLRIVPQVHGAAAELLGHLRAQLERELRAVTDSPVFLAAEPDGLYSTGNFHAQYLVVLLDASAVAFTQVVNLLEKRLHRLLDTRFSELPDQLTADPGRQSGVVVLHKQVIGLAAEARTLAAPATVHAIDGSTGQEDFQTHTLLSAHQLDRILSLLELALAHELIALRQAQFLAEAALPAPLQEAVARIAAVVSPLTEDRSLAGDIERARELVASGELIGRVRSTSIWS